MQAWGVDMDTRIAVLSGAPGDTARLAESLRDRLGARAVIVRIAPTLLPIHFKIVGPLRVKGRTIKRHAVVDGEDMNRLLSEWRLHMLIVDQVEDATLVDEIRTSFSRFATVHIHLAPGPAPWQAGLRGARSPPRPARTRTSPAVSRPDAQALLAERADAVISTQRCTRRDILARAAARLQPTRSNTAGYVDVIVGGQYGSEGKGQIAAYLAKEYDLLVRVGGPNAGHKVPGRPTLTYNLLPSGTNRSTARLSIGPGSAIDVDKLLREIRKNRVDEDEGRLSIDPNAVIITESDKEDEKALKNEIGSTAQGVGRATSRKVMRGKGTILAKHVEELKPYCRPMLEVLEDAVARGGRVMLEGTQGTGLSIHHGHYPYVTSRETTASGCLADAGINPRLVRRVIMVARTYPIRVQSPPGGTSGYMSGETSFGEISRRSGKDLGKIRDTERGSVTGKRRRIGEFDWDLIRRAALLNGATDVALTFADYISARNENAYRFEQLTPETIGMVEEVERVTEAQVSLIATGFSPRSVIDRREW